MPNRIAQVNRGGISTWDVKFEVKEGAVALPNPHAIWLARMLSENASHQLPPGLTWVDSLRGLLGVFQKHVDEGTSAFYWVPSLHFLRLSMSHETAGGQDRYYFHFQTEFHDPTEDEQEYIDDMYEKYGPLMLVVWMHCKNVDGLLEAGDPPIPPPAQGQAAVPPLVKPPLPSYKLKEAFLQLVDQNQVDNVPAAPGAPTDRALCFFVANPNVSPSNVKTWKKDSTKLASVAGAVQTARQELQQPGPDKGKILDDLMTKFAALGV
jgi:hypothetical protein